MQFFTNKKLKTNKGSLQKSSKPNFRKKNFKKFKVEIAPLLEESESEESDDFSTSNYVKEFEKRPRLQKSPKVRNLLPVKTATGFVFRSEVLPKEEEPKESVGVTTVKSYAFQPKDLEDLKSKVALLSTSLLEEPDNNILALKELISLLQNPTTKMVVSEKRVLCLSLLNVFKDILPSYRIRLEDARDSKIYLKKDTRKLIGYEQTLLKCYEKYIALMYELIRNLKLTVSKTKTPGIKQRVAYEIGLIAVKCMCELLSTKFTFNYFKNIANKLVPLSVDVDEKITSMCCQAFERLFKADKLGEASFNLVKHIIDVIKERNFCIPVALLRTFLNLNLREAKVEVEKIDMHKGRKEWRAMSRTDKKDKRKMKDLEAELKEAQAYESNEMVKQFHTKTLNKIFWVFFHILKDGEKVDLIAPALEGLARFAYLINLEFFDDLNLVLCGMMESGKLSDVEKLHGVYTLFTILAGQAESLHIDPHRIYCHMYQGLLNLGHSVDIKNFVLTLKCLEYNILRKRKKIPSSRILAFAKRASTVSLQAPIHGALGLLSTVQKIITNIKSSDVLLDSESTLGSGLYLPELEDPDHCNPHSTALWELHLLKNHFNPTCKLFSKHILHGCPRQGRMSLPHDLEMASSEEILHMMLTDVSRLF